MADLLNPTLLRTAATQSVLDNHASEFAKRIFHMIQEYDAKLDAAHEVGLWLANFGQTIIVHIEDIGYSNPSLIWFIGRSGTGDPVELVQHVSQINVLLMTLPRDPGTPKKTIGFLHKPEEEAGA